MSNYCLNPVVCPNGNCIGCKDGKTWCQDPRCQPNCQDCNLPVEFDFQVNLTLSIIIACLLFILIFVWFGFGPRLFTEVALE